MKTLISKLQEQMLNSSDEEFSIISKEFNSRRKEIENILFHKKLEERALELKNLLKETKYREPLYPQMGTSSSNGSCTFSSKEQSERLINLLVAQSYFFGHSLKWSGPGECLIRPEYGYDHDRDIIYTAYYEKKD